MSNKFASRHYVALLDLLADVDKVKGIDRATIGEVVNSLDDMFSRDNDRYNSDRFYTYWDKIRS